MNTNQESWEQERLQWIVSAVNSEWPVKRCLKHTEPADRACSSSVRKAEMRNASERRFKRQSSVIGNDRHTQSIHHSWPLHFSLYVSHPFSLSSIQDKDKESKEKVFRRLYLSLWKSMVLMVKPLTWNQLEENMKWKDWTCFVCYRYADTYS